MTEKQFVVTRDDAVLLSALVAHAERSRDRGIAERTDRLLAPRAAMNSTVEYEDVETGSRARVRLAHPADADAGRGRISVLSPVGRALLGLREGHVADVMLPSGDTRRLLIVAVHEELQR